MLLILWIIVNVQGFVRFADYLRECDNDASDNHLIISLTVTT